MKSIAHLCLVLLALCAPALAENGLFNPRFGQIETIRFLENPSRAIVFFSDHEGFRRESLDIAKALAERDSFVIGIDTGHYLKSIQSDDEDCSYLAGEIERLSQSVQKSAGLKNYIKPILAGYGDGAALAYSINAEFPSSFEGLLTIGFCPTLPISQKLCDGEGLETNIDEKQHRLEILPADNLLAPWYELHNADNRHCSNDQIKDFVSEIENANLVSLKADKHPFAMSGERLKQFDLAFDKIAQSEHRMRNLEPVSELPIVEVPAQGPQKDYFAVFFSGDGGWATIDKEIGSYLAEHGVAVAGFDCLKFFWKERTAAEISAALETTIKHYSELWKKNKVIVIGYSLGANILPFGISGLSAELSKKVVLASILSPSIKTDFEIQIGDWIGMDSGEEHYEIMPEIEKMKDIKILCVYGKEDMEDNLCPLLSVKEKKNPRIKTLQMEGSHHFNGNYEPVAEEIIKQSGQK